VHTPNILFSLIQCCWRTTSDRLNVEFGYLSDFDVMMRDLQGIPVSASGVMFGPSSMPNRVSSGRPPENISSEPGRHEGERHEMANVPFGPSFPPGADRHGHHGRHRSGRAHRDGTRGWPAAFLGGAGTIDKPAAIALLPPIRPNLRQPAFAVHRRGPNNLVAGRQSAV
jgi:hypothetical protein